MNRPIARLVTAAVATTGLILGFSGSVGASVIEAHPRAAAAFDPLTTPMQRDLGLTEAQVAERIQLDLRAGKVEKRLGSELAGSYAGTWIADGERIVVATTDRADIDRIRATGAEPRLVAHSERQLTAVKTELDKAPRPSADAVAGWYVDTVNNRVVVTALPGGQDAARAFIAESGVDTDAVEVTTTDAAPRTFYDVQGGDAYYPGGARCSIGFAVEGGFVTAGHCGSAGTQVSGYNQVAMGSVADSSFPGDDHAWVSVNSDWTPQPWVNDYDGGVVTVAGSAEAAVGASVCRSGSTTGWHCGEIEAKDQTVNYAEGTVYGLTQTSVCAEPGDSGGSYISGDQAQGVTSGGSGDCSTGGTTFFQPVNEILETYGLTLVTG